MALILNIETSTEVCSVTISENGKLLYIKETLEGLSHSELLTVFIEELFAENNLSLNELDAVAVSKGPGSYTGLRIGVSVAKGLCYGLEIPLIAVNSLETMGTNAALNSPENALFCPMIDARRMEVYTALYNKKGEEIKPVSAEIIEEDFLNEYLEDNKIRFIGNGAEKCKTKITHANAIFDGPLKTSAQFMQKLTEEKYNKKEFEDVAYFEPFYLKNFVATIPKNKLLK
ncbi:MAG: tRNA (adenosine(37)-N6)-threonylcarbamoyltransferase complex dimerization subunit type 1 TsaB [Draconibacterium sp.]|nr:tRNA (adenosine(37)-N6)-threonylcarbamoyltransferase complex dimerization subunit type 1 TsaB [Draconibacterium sp.]